MDRQKYSLLRKLKIDTINFEKKLNYYESKVSYDEKIKSLISEIKDIRIKKEEATKASNSSDNHLKTYIAELNAKIFPNTWQTNYGDKNIQINLSNINMLTFLQKYKNQEFIKDKYKLEDEIVDLFQKLDKKQTNRIKTQLKEDKINGEIMEKEKYQLSLIKDKFSTITHDIEKYEYNQKEYKIKLDIVKKINKKLNETLNIEKIKYNKLSEMIKNQTIKNLKIEINNKNNDNYDSLRNFIFLSEKKFLSVENTRRNSLKLFDNKNKKNKNKIKMNPYLIKNYKGYKTPLYFLKKNKKLFKNINNINNTNNINNY